MGYFDFITELYTYLDFNKIVTSDDIVFLYRKYCDGFYGDYKNILIKRLCDEGHIYSYGFGTYKAYSGRIKYKPYRNKNIENMINGIISNKGINMAYFNTAIFNELSSLQSFVNYDFLEIESFGIKYLEDYLIKKGKKVIDSRDYVTLKRIYKAIDFDFDYILKTFNENTPFYKERGSPIYYPGLETLLVDLLTDSTLDYMFGSQIETIFRNSFSKYAIKINTLMRYARKKGIDDKVRWLLKTIKFDMEKGEFYD